VGRDTPAHIFVSDADFAAGSYGPITRHEMDHARGSNAGSVRGSTRPGEYGRVPIDDPSIDRDSIVRSGARIYIDGGFSADEIYTAARDLRRTASMHNRSPSAATWHQLERTATRGRTLAVATAEHADKALRVVDQDPRLIRIIHHDDLLHAEVPVGDVTVAVNIQGAPHRVQFPFPDAPDPAVQRVVRQRLEELRDTSNTAARGFERYSAELERVRPSLWERLRGGARAPSASDLHLSTRELGPAGSLPRRGTR
jgi:hypothetical protein